VPGDVEEIFGGERRAGGRAAGRAGNPDWRAGDERAGQSDDAFRTSCSSAS